MVQMLPSFLEKQANCDLEVWKKNFFSGMSYAKMLRLARRRGKVTQRASGVRRPVLRALRKAGNRCFDIW